MGCSSSNSASVAEPVKNTNKTVSPGKQAKKQESAIRKTKTTTEDISLIKQKTVFGETDNTQNLKFDNFAFSEVNFSAKNVSKYYKKQSPPQSGADWEDPLFPHNAASILSQKEDGSWIDKDSSRRDEGSLASEIEHIEWKKAKDIFKGEFALFEGEIAIDDLKQGSLGNCYMLAAISAMAENPQMIAQLFPFFDVDRGYFEVLVKIDGDFKKVVVDDYFPVDKRNGNPFFVKPNGHELWAMLLEKVWAKVNGGYLNTIAGVSVDVLFAFTPFPCKYIFHKFSSSYEEEDFFDRLVEAEKKNFILSTSSKQNKEVEALGLVSGHAFTLLAAMEHNGVRLVKLRNPWGAKEWNGDWSDNSSKWTSEMKQAVGYVESKNEGIFYMEFSDFIKHFGNTEICERVPKLCSKTRRVKKAQSHLPQVTGLTVYNDCTLYLQFNRKSWRFNREIQSTDYVPQTFILGKKNGSANGFDILGIASESSDVCLIEREVEKGDYIVWSYADYPNAKMPKQYAYNINVSCSDYFDLEPLGEDKELVLVKNLLLNEGKEAYCEQDLCHYEGYEVQQSNVVVKAFVNRSLTSSAKVKIDSSATQNYSLFGGQLNGEVTLTPGSEMVIYGWVKDIYAGGSYAISASWSMVPYREEHGDKNCRCTPGDFISLEEKTVDNQDNNYSYLFKELDFDFSTIVKQINPAKVNWNYFSNKYPELVEQIEAMECRPEDQGKVVLQDKYEFGNGSYYFGEWNTENNTRQGRAVYDFGDDSKHVGYWHNGVFEGMGTMHFGPDDWLRINFVDGCMDGEGLQRQPDGQEHRILYDMDNFVKYL